MTQQPPPGHALPPGPPPEPAPPSLGTMQTTLPGQVRLALRHPGELPWLAVAAGFFLLHILMVILLVGSMIAVAPMGAEGDAGLIWQVVLLSLFLPLIVLISRALLYAQQRVNAVRMSPTQFPEAYRMVCEAAYVAGLRRVPDAYVVSGNGAINAFASGHGFRRFIAVYSDLFEIGGEARDPDALRFIIGHEVGHIAAGHTSYFRLVLSSTIMQLPIFSGFLSRAQEYTADNFGYRYCSRGAAGAMATLAAGKYLNVDVNGHEFADRATTERGLWVWAVNLLASHPVLTWRAHALRDRSQPGALFLQPSFQPSGVGALPGGVENTEVWPTPAEALAYLDAHPATGPSQFGANFPVPPPGRGEGRRDTGYGRGQLRHGWAHGPGPGMWGGPQPR